MPKPYGTYSRIANKAKIDHTAKRDKEFVRVAHQADIDSTLQRLNLEWLRTQHRRLASMVAERNNVIRENEHWLKVVKEALETIDELTEKFRLEDLEHLYGVKIDPVLIEKGSQIDELRTEIRDLRGELTAPQAGSIATIKSAKQEGSMIILAIALCKFMAILLMLLNRSEKNK